MPVKVKSADLQVINNKLLLIANKPSAIIFNFDYYSFYHYSCNEYILYI